MQLNVCTANKLSALCQRVNAAEKKAGLTANVVPRAPNAIPQNPFTKLNNLCQRIVALEKIVGIPKVNGKSQHFKPLGPSGNAVLSNKVNTLCSRIARVEKNLSNLTPLEPEEPVILL
jgi:hypothetical protein